MSAAIEILPVKAPKTERPKGLADFLPAPPFCCLVNGGVRSGKSNLVCNLFLRRELYRGYFTSIVVISPTAANDNSLAPLLSSRIVKHYGEYSDDLISGLIKDQQEAMQDAIDEGDTVPELLIILDDVVGLISKSGSVISGLATRYRHSHISLCFVSQVFREMPVPVRVNLTFAVLFRPAGKKEVAKIAEEFEGSFGDVSKLLDEATQKPYDFLFLNFQRAEAWECFGRRLLWSKATAHEKGAPANSPPGNLRLISK